MPSLPPVLQGYLNWEYGVFITLIVLIEVIVARAFLLGIASAEDPMHRAVPVSRWYFFDRVVWRRVKRWLPWWGVMAAAVYVFHYYRFSTGWIFTGYDPALYRLYFVFQWTLEIVWSVLLTVAALWWLAPRVREVWLLVPAAFAVSLGLEIWFFSPLLEWAIPEEWRYVSQRVEYSFPGMTGPGGGAFRLARPAVTTVEYDLFQVYYLALVGVFCAWAGWLARKMGDGWFRIGEE